MDPRSERAAEVMAVRIREENGRARSSGSCRADMQRRVTMERKRKKSKGKAAGRDRYNVMLTGGGDQRIAVAKVFNEFSGMRQVGAELQEIFSRPTPIKEGVTKDEAAQIKRRIEEAGGSVKITRTRG
jgi:ribosomal protein L7/L12